jgi:catecholate siderophore receptor
VALIERSHIGPHDENITVQEKGTNLSNTLGLDQGGGQQLVPGAADGAVTLARLIFGRAAQGSVSLKF